MKNRSIKFKLIAIIASCLLLGTAGIILLLNDSYEENITSTGTESVKQSAAMFNALMKKEDKAAGNIELAKVVDNLFDSIKKQTGDDFVIFFDKKAINEKDWADLVKEKDIEGTWKDFDSLAIVGDTQDKGERDEELAMEVNDIKGGVAGVSEGGMVLEEAMEKIGDKMKVKGAFPIFDSAKNKVGVVFVYHDITTAHNEMSETQTQVIASVLGLMVVLLVVIIYVINKLIVKRLNHVIEVTTTVVGGDFNSSIEVTSNDEIGQIEGLIEQFRMVFVNVLGEMNGGNQAESESATSQEDK